MSNYSPGSPDQARQTNAKSLGEKANRKENLSSIENTKASILKEQEKLTKAEKAIALKQAEITLYKILQTPKLPPEGPGVPTSAQKTHLAKLEGQKTNLSVAASTSRKTLLELNVTLKTLQFEASRGSAAKDVTTDLQSTTDIKTEDVGDPTKLVYEYNLPMLNSAYLSPGGINSEGNIPLSPQGRSLSDPKLIAAPGFINDRVAWDGIKASRGTIQMSKLFALKAFYDHKKTGQKRNENPYGFRFMYNPTEVTMAWGIVDAFSPEYAQSGENGMSGVAVGLMKGTIAFTLLLNRIGDMNLLSKDGSFVPGTYPKDPTDKIDTEMIYRKGTMYDLEYLFKAMGGFSADYKSGLNGMTADRGWLQPIPLELTLGPGLRYLVRVSSCDLKHIMFNERMVPILTTVNLVCTRYYDSPDAFGDPNTLGKEAFAPEKTQP